MANYKKKARQLQVASGEGYCRRCRKVMSLSKFYEATNPLIDTNGYLSVCKDCCNEIYNQYFAINKDMERALYLTCEDLDVCFSKDAFIATRTHIESALSSGKKINAVFGVYKSKLSSTAKKNNMATSFRFKDSDLIYNNVNLDVTNYKDTNFEITEDQRSFWGSGFLPEEYEYLTSKFFEYLNTYECETPAMEELLKQAAFESLEIRNRRQRREDVSKNLKNLQDILGSANIKPVQESGANATDQATFGTLIKKWENEEPIPEPDEEWKDVDGIGRYIRIWFLGHLCKMLGITNEYSKEYEEEMAKLRVEVPSEEVDVDAYEGD